MHALPLHGLYLVWLSEGDAVEISDENHNHNPQRKCEEVVHWPHANDPRGAPENPNESGGVQKLLVLLEPLQIPLREVSGGVHPHGGVDEKQERGKQKK